MRGNRVRLPAIAVALIVAGLAVAPSAQARGRLLGLVAPSPTAGPALSGRAAPPQADGQFASQPAAAAGPTRNLVDAGGPVMRSHKTFVIFWDPAGALDGGFKAEVQRFLTDVAADSGTPTNVYSVATEYGDAGAAGVYASSFGGTYTDRTPYTLTSCAQGGLNLFPAPCLTDAAIQAEVAAALAANGWGPGLDRAYFVVLPSGVLSCANATSGQCSPNVFCAYHSQLDPRIYPSYPDANPVLYGFIPWGAVSGCNAPGSPNGSDADAAVNLIGHEHIEMVTDPLVDRPAWIDQTDGSEIADKCRAFYGDRAGPTGAEYNQTIDGNHYLLQGEWSNAQQACLQRTAADRPPAPSFTVATTDHQQFTFDAAASSDPDGHLLSFSWDFGDGQAASTAQASHTYPGTGARTVTLTVADNAGGVASSAQTVTVGPPAPPPPPPPAPAPVTTDPPAPAEPTPPAATPVQATTQDQPAAAAQVLPAAVGSVAASTPAPAPAPGRAAPTRLVASAAFGALGPGGLTWSARTDRRVRATIDLLIARATAVRLHIPARADGGPRSRSVILGETATGALGPGRAAHRVRITPAAFAALRRARRAGAVVVDVRLTVVASGQAPRVFTARRPLHL